MKTSNKTNSRFFGIAVIIMVLSLVCGNLAAQKSYNQNSLANLSNEFFMNIKNEIAHAISDVGTDSKETDLEPIEDWMTDLADWDETEAVVIPEETNFEEQEMILEDWMMSTSWEDCSLIEEELQLEDWMSSPELWDSEVK